MTPFEEVQQHYQFPKEIRGVPFVPHPLQVQDINELAPLPEQGHWEDMGTGKTFIATACALYGRIRRGEVTVVLMPPILLTQWAAWLSLIRPKLSVTVYRGTPKQRALLSLDSDFVLVGVQIFKKDYARFVQHYQDKKVFVIMDEATFAANIGSDIHDKLYDFCVGRSRAPLSGTPANKPDNAYGLMKFSAPGTYRNKKQFENAHVEERDFFKNPTKWCNLDVLKLNLMRNSFRLLYKDMYPDAVDPHYDPITYELGHEHGRLYERLANEQLLMLPDGGKIDATTVSRLIHSLGQIIINADHFSGGVLKESAGLDLIEQKLEELGDQKLVVFANYRMTIASIVKRFHNDFGAVGVNSEVSAAGKENNLRRFTSERSCRLIAIQFISGGKGLDGLQHVCNHGLFIEPCQQPRDFHQAVARLQRTGQVNKVWIGMATAAGTLQVSNFKALLKNDDLVNSIIRSPISLRNAIFGKEAA